MKDDIKKQTPKHLPAATLPVHQEGVTMGVFLMLASASITWTTYSMIAGTNGWVRFVLVAPQAALGAYIIVRKFINK